MTPARTRQTIIMNKDAHPVGCCPLSSSKAPGGEEKLREISESAADTRVGSSFIHLIQHDQELSKVAPCPEWTDISAN